MSCASHLQQSARSTWCCDRSSRRQEVPPVFRRSWHPLQGSSTRTKRRPAQRWACASKPDAPEGPRGPRLEKQDNKEAWEQYVGQLRKKQAQARPQLSLRERAAKQWAAFIGMAPLTIGGPGTAAVIAAYYLHLDPYGHFHWSSTDALVGLACAAPIAVVDFAMMIPDFSAGSWGSASSVSIDTSRLAAKAKQAKAATEKLLQSDEMQSRFHNALKQRNSERDPAAPDTSKLDALHALTEAARQTADQPSGDTTSAVESTPAASESADGQQETVPADKPGRINADRLLGQPPGNVITETLDRWQRTAVLQNSALDLEGPVEAGYILLAHFADEMLYRAVILQGLALWVTDRLYEANAEEMIPGIGDNAMAVTDTGKWTALAVLIGVQLGWGARGFLRPVRMQLRAVQMDKPNLEPPTLESASRKRKETEEVVTHITKKLNKQRKASVVVDTIRGSVTAAALGSSFILTGNLLAPYLGSVTCDLLFSYYQRRKYQKLKSKIEQHVKSLVAEVMSKIKA